MNILSEAYFVVPHTVLHRLSKDVTIRELMDYFEDTRKKCKVATGSMWDNGRGKISNVYGYPCSVSFEENTPNRFHDNTYYTIFVWDVMGSTKIVFWDFEVDAKGHVRPGEFDTVIEYMNDYTAGIVHYSHCQKSMAESEIVGRYFAGVYCEKCWTTQPTPSNSYKRMEARETYE